MGFKDQFRSVIQWENPSQDELFVKFTDNGDELKNASKLIVGPGQGCLFIYEGKIEGAFEEEGMYDLKTDNTPFLTTIKKFLTLSRDADSEHKTGLWFYRKADIVNIRWGTRSTITYNDPVYTFPVGLRCFGNYSIRIIDATTFFTNVVAGEELFTTGEIQEIFVSRIVQPITDYLAKAKFSYAEIDSNVNEVARFAKEDTFTIFKELGFELKDFRIEGTSFDEGTQQRIGKIADVNADVQAAKLAGLDYAQMEQVKAMRDAAKNESGITGLGAGMGVAMNLGNMMGNNMMMGNQMQNTQQQPPQQTTSDDPMQKLKKLKEMFEMELITEQEFAAKKKEILDTL